MNRTRFEIDLRKNTTQGRVQCRIYDEYWDSMTYASFEIGHPEQVDLRAFRELRKTIAGLDTGWYAIEIEDYPFGEATRVFKIPGRHLRYSTIYPAQRQL